MDQQFANQAEWRVPTHHLGYAVQEFLMLHDQHEELCQRLHELSHPLPTPASLSPLPPCTTASNTTAPVSLVSTAVTSPSVSPTRSPWGRYATSPTRLSVSPSRDARMASRTHMLSPGGRTRSGRHPMTIDGSLIEEVAADQQKLVDVNEGLKRALTELLNCEAVRQDRAMRTWVQTRLLETEKELRRGRRRRSSMVIE